MRDYYVLRDGTVESDLDTEGCLEDCHCISDLFFIIKVHASGCGCDCDDCGDCDCGGGCCGACE